MYKRTLKNSGAKHNWSYKTSTQGKREILTPRSRAEVATCDSFGWDSYDAADTYGKAQKGTYSVTACSFCGKWHVKKGEG